MATVIPVDVTEALMGHEGYLTEVYRRYSLEDLAKFYKQGEHTLLIFAEAGEVSKLRAEIEERNRQLQALVNGLIAENMELKNRLKILEEHVKEVREFLGIDKLSKEELDYWYKEFKALMEKLGLYKPLELKDLKK